MKIFIITMDDPVFTRGFIKEIIEHRSHDIVGLAVSKGGRMKIGKQRSKIIYALSLMLIMGLPFFIENSIKTIVFKLKKTLHKAHLTTSPSITSIAEKHGIKTWSTNSPNSDEFKNILKDLKPDVIISQSQHILKKELLSIPTIGVLNRHNALLPKNRGRLTPFWVLFRKEKESGVSIHFVNEEIDAGEIVVQERFEIETNETFESLVKKNYQYAGKAMLKALTILEEGKKDFIENNETEATYNTVPSFKDARQFRWNKMTGK